MNAAPLAWALTARTVPSSCYKTSMSSLTRTRSALAGFALAVLGVFCSKPETKPKVENESEVKTDLAQLRRYLPLPQGIKSARWILRAVRPQGSSLPGPTDTLLLAYLETQPNFWAELGPAFGARKPVTRHLRATDARGLLPPQLLAAATPAGDGYDLACESLDPAPFRSAVRTPAAFRCGDGLLVSLFMG